MIKAHFPGWCYSEVELGSVGAPLVIGDMSLKGKLGP